MIRPVFLFLLFSLLLTKASAQTFADTGSVVITEDKRVMLLVDKWKEVKARANGKTSGWRVKIHFSTDREKAKGIKADFLAKYPDVRAYEVYQQPLFVIVVGDFRTRMEAYNFLQEIKDNYSSAFIIQDQIELPSVELAKPENDPGKETK